MHSVSESLADNSGLIVMMTVISVYLAVVIIVAIIVVRLKLFHTGWSLCFCCV